MNKLKRAQHEFYFVSSYYNTFGIIHRIIMSLNEKNDLGIVFWADVDFSTTKSGKIGNNATMVDDLSYMRESFITM